MSNFLLITLSLTIGYLLRLKLPMPLQLANYLNRFVITVALPAMILIEIPKLHFTLDALIPIMLSWTVMCLTAITLFMMANYLQFSKPITGSLMLVTVLTNSSFVGIPLITTYLGEQSLPYIIIYDQLGTFLALATYGAFIVSYYSHASTLQLQSILSKVLRFPPFIALLLGLILPKTILPHFITEVCTLLSYTIVPFSLIAVGLQLYFKLDPTERLPFGIALILKLIIAPLFAIVLAHLMGWSGLSVQVSILEAGMPPMITAAAVASLHGLAPRLSSAIVGYGILLSFLSTWILYLYIKAL